MLIPKILVNGLVVLCSSLGISCSPLQIPIQGACTNPTVRREWRTFSVQEKSAWIQAVNCLSHLPHDPALTPTVDRSISRIPPINTSGSYFDDLAYIHMDLNTRIHFTGLFLPWHRWFLYAFEQSLKNKCGYTGVSPYWNWTLDADHIHESSIWDPDPESGLGGWGDPNEDYEVYDGGFSKLHVSYPSPHILRRKFTLRPFNLPLPFFTEPLKEANITFTADKVERLIHLPVGDFRWFQSEVEAFQGAHSGIHLMMGGDMGGQCPKNAPPNCTIGPLWSPNEPLFWLHHAMVDKMWYEWQRRSPESAKSYFGGSVPALEDLNFYYQYPNGAPPYLHLNSSMPVDGMFPEVTIGDMMNTTEGPLCYVYE